MRPYRRGDRISRIDWAASARLSAARGTDEFVTREFFADQAPRVVVVCDRRPAMAVYGGGLPWLDKAAAAAGVFELVASSVIAERADLAYADQLAERATWLAPSPSAHAAVVAHRLPPRRGRGLPTGSRVRSNSSSGIGRSFPSARSCSSCRTFSAPCRPESGATCARSSSTSRR